MDTKSDEILKKMFDSFDELKSGQIKSSIHLSFWELKILYLAKVQVQKANFNIFKDTAFFNGNDKEKYFVIL